MQNRSRNRNRDRKQRAMRVKREFRDRRRTWTYPAAVAPPPPPTTTPPPGQPLASVLSAIMLLRFPAPFELRTLKFLVMHSSVILDGLFFFYPRVDSPCACLPAPPPPPLHFLFWLFISPCARRSCFLAFVRRLPVVTDWTERLLFSLCSPFLLESCCALFSIVL